MSSLWCGLKDSAGLAVGSVGHLIPGGCFLGCCRSCSTDSKPKNVTPALFRFRNKNRFYLDTIEFRVLCPSSLVSVLRETGFWPTFTRAPTDAPVYDNQRRR